MNIDSRHFISSFRLTYTLEVPFISRIKATPKSHRTLKYFPVLEYLMQFCNDGLAGSNVPFKLTFITASPLPAILKITVPRRLDTSTFLRGVPTVPTGVGPGAVKRGYRVVCVGVYEFYTLSLILKKSGSHQEKNSLTG